MCYESPQTVSVAGSAIKWLAMKASGSPFSEFIFRLRDSMKIIGEASEINELVKTTKTTHGVYLWVHPPSFVAHVLTDFTV